VQPAVTKCLLWVKMCPFGLSSLYPTTTLPLFQLVARRSSVWAFALQVCLLHQDDEEIHGARTERYDLCAICQKSVSDREFERAESQHFAALIAMGYSRPCRFLR